MSKNYSNKAFIAVILNLEIAFANQFRNLGILKESWCTIEFVAIWHETIAS